MDPSSPSDEPEAEPAPALDTLATEERAAVVAAVLAAGQRAPTLLHRLDGAAGPRCAAVARGLLGGDREQRARRLAGEVAALRSPVPAGAHRIHPDWLAAGAGGDDEALERALAGAGGPEPALARWLQRSACADLVAMPEQGGAGGVEPGRRLVALTTSALTAALATWGRKTLAAAVAGAPAEQIAELAARLGHTQGTAFVRDVAAAQADTGLAGACARLLAGAVGSSTI